MVIIFQSHTKKNHKLCCNVTFKKGRSVYPDDALLGLADEFTLELLGHLRVQELSEGSLDGQSSLPVPLLHLVTELVPVVELFDFIKVRLIPGISEERRDADTHTHTHRREH